MRLEPTISTLTSIRSIQRAKRNSIEYMIRKYITLKPGSVAQSVTCLTAIPRGRKFDPGPVPYFRGD